MGKEMRVSLDQGVEAEEQMGVDKRGRGGEDRVKVEE